MKIDSIVYNGVKAQNINTHGELLAQSKAASEVDSSIKKGYIETNKKVEREETINDVMLDNAVEQANKSLRVHNKYIERSVHEKTHTIMYILRDTETKEIISEFPPRKIQDMIAKMWELAGLLVDERR